MIKKTRSIENKEMPAENLVMYDNPQRQFVDLYSRFGIWEDVDSDEFGSAMLNCPVSVKGNILWSHY